MREPAIGGLAMKGFPCDHPTLRVKVALPGIGWPANLTENAP
jgi:hypothetical protein